MKLNHNQVISYHKSYRSRYGPLRHEAMSKWEYGIM